ncbi:MAG: hypothetical protein LBG69_08950 [Zoogloeaceae bacterium]|jgi:hypothetical protein|nr:hypothetical protein [Zoogloeaceae bacterium]
MNKAWRAGFAALLFLVLLGAGWALRRADEDGAPVEVLPFSGCDLTAEFCEIAVSETLLSGEKAARKDDEVILRFEFSPRPITAMHVFSARVTARRRGGAERPFSGFRAARLEISGVEMDMGPNEQTLREIAPGVFQGETALPVCVSGAMRWRADFVLSGERAELAVPFYFSVGAP